MPLRPCLIKLKMYLCSYPIQLTLYAHLPLADQWFNAKLVMIDEK